MKINKDNYEIYILDYYEGKLTPGVVRELFAFLEMNPEIKAEFDQFEEICIADASAVQFEFKESLKKINASTPILITTSNYREFFIAAVEGDLSIAQKKQLEIFLAQHPNLNNDFHLFKIAKLSADTSIVYENKYKLKKFTIFSPVFNKKVIYQISSIAASLLIMISVVGYYFINNDAVKPVTSAVIQTKNTSDGKIAHSDKIPIQGKLNNDNLLSTVHHKAAKKQTFKEDVFHETNPSAKPDYSVLSMLPKTVQKINEAGSNLYIDENNRNYFTSINLLLALEDEQTNNRSEEKNPDKEKPSRFEFDTDLLKGQPIAEAGGFLKNVAVLGFTKIEEISSTAKDTYLALEEKVSIK
jgi:hypothetical protein